MKKFLFAILFLPFMQAVNAQDTVADVASKGKKIVDHTVYDSWKSIFSPTISNDGKWVAYEVNPQVGDGKLFLYNVEKQSLDSFDRGKSPAFLYAGEGYLVYKIAAPYKLTRKAKLDKKKPDDMPKDSLAVYNLVTKKTFVMANVKSFSVNDYVNYVVAHQGKEKKQPVKLTKKQEKKRKKNPPVEVKSDGTTLVLWNVLENKQQKFRNVTEYTLPEKSTTVGFVVQEKGKHDSSFVYVGNWAEPGTNTQEVAVLGASKVFSINGWTKGLVMDEAGKNLSFISSTDTAKNNKVYQLYLKQENSEPVLILDTNTNTSFSKKLTVSENTRSYFSENGKKLYFGIAPIPVKEPKDTLLEDEKYVLDIWHWKDDRIMPEQLKQLERDKKRTFTTCFDLTTRQFLQIENDSMRMVQSLMQGNGDIYLTVSDKPYRITQSWETQVPADYYITDFKTGTARPVLTNKTHSVNLSYAGKYVVWYDPNKRDWFSKNLATGESFLITSNVDDNLFEDNNGLPELPEAYGIMGWSQNDEYVYIYSEYEIWKVHPENKEPVLCLTKNKGGEYNTDLRYVRLNKDIRYIDDKWLLLKSFNHHNKREGFWVYTNGNIQPLLVEDYRFSFIGKAKNNDRLLYTKMNFQTFPDLNINDLSFKNEKRISNANPQQKDYAWGTVELVKWKSFNGSDLEGLLYKPENMEPNKKYPMIVYFYEKYSDALHQYRSPRPSASTVNFTEYTSNGYVIFVPDIVYTVGDPGKSAYDCIVSGTKAMLEKGFVDEKHMALQGQSWGGYQTAFLVTQTDMYAAAFAGAPVSNMTSAYGGIRWESGLVRAFQYEKGQSRIGKTLWEDREAYIRNSPLFHLDKVATPLLLMNNDADGAVPWYQGIELYNGLRRLQKPTWLLNYNGDAHNLTKRPNQVDLSRRMMQFFNHYLKGEPMPQWMKEGVQAVDKGKVTGYELMVPSGR